MRERFSRTLERPESFFTTIAVCRRIKIVVLVFDLFFEIHQAQVEEAASTW